MKTGPAPQFLFTLSLLFDFKTRVHVPAHCVPRWQMTASEHAVSQKYKQGNDTGLLCYFPKCVIHSATLLSILM